MGFKRIISFDHLAVGPISVVNSESYAGLSIFGNGYGQGPPTVVVDTDNRKKVCNGGLYSECVFKFGNIGLDISKKVIMGFRHKPESLSVFGFGITDGIAIRSNIIWTCTQIGQTGEAYVEVVFDFVLNKVSVFVDKVNTKTVNYPAKEMSEFFTKYGCFTFYGNDQNFKSWISDVYFRDQVGSEVIDPIGSVVLIPIALEITGDGWVPATGLTLTNTLTAVAQAGTPVATNSGVSPVAPLIATPTLIGDDNRVVLAASFISSSMDNGTPAKSILGKLTVAGEEMIGNSSLLTSTMKPGKNIGLFEKAPDGSALTIGKLKASTFKVTLT